MLIEHIALYVKDLEKAKIFFMTYFQAVPNERYYNSKTGLKTYFLSFDSGSRLEIMTKDTLKEKSGSDLVEGYHHLAFAIENRKSLDVLTKRLKSDGYQILSGPRVTGDGYYESLFLYEKHHIELVSKK